MGKAIEAEIQNEPVVAKLLREAAEQNRQAIEFFRQSAMAHAVEKIREAYSYLNAGSGHYRAGEQMGKAIEADRMQLSHIAQAFREAVQQNLKSVKFSIKSVKAYAAEKIEKGLDWNRIGCEHLRKAQEMEKAIEGAK